MSRVHVLEFHLHKVHDIDRARDEEDLHHDEVQTRRREEGKVTRDKDSHIEQLRLERDACVS